MNPVQGSHPGTIDLTRCRDGEMPMSTVALDGYVKSRIDVKRPAADPDDAASNFSSFVKLYRTVVPRRPMTARSAMEALDVIGHASKALARHDTTLLPCIRS